MMKYTFQTYKKSDILRDHLNVGGSDPAGETIDVTSLYFERGGKPWLPVMGEYHFERDSRDNWYNELCKMKAGGIDIVSTYLIWIYHEEEKGKINFTGDNNLRSFVLEAERAGLDVIIRIGPWAHGEARNGGFPDWVLKEPYPLRESNPQYMALIRGWYSAIYNEVSDLFYKDGGNIIGVQLENEYVDSAEHLADLKQLAQEIGYDVPLWTVTGWNSSAGAKIPVKEVVPVFGGYVEMPWSEKRTRLEPSIHFFFNKMRNDSAIGADLIADKATDGWQLPYELYPFATCELGAGTQNTHHRRAIMDPMDTYAMSLTKLGSGNNLIGYYMYHGGTNKLGKLSTFQESRATGYPNDLPMLSYDFQAPVSQYGEIREHYRLMNMLHLFVHDFGSGLAEMEAVEQAQPVRRDDTQSLRYAMRTDGKSGYVFVNHYQRFDELTDVKAAVIDTGVVQFPPIDVCGKISFFMPFNMQLGETCITYATAQPLCRMENTCFFAAIPGIQPVYCINGKEYRDRQFTADGVQIVTLSWDEARFARMLDGELYIGEHEDLYFADGKIKTVSGNGAKYRLWNGNSFDIMEVEGGIKQAHITVTDAEQPFEPPYKEELEINGERALTWKKLIVDSDEGFVELENPCDVMQIYADGAFVADEFYYGAAWRIPAKLLYGKECYLVSSEMKDDFYREF